MAASMSRAQGQVRSRRSSGAAGGADEPAGDGEQAQPQPFRFGDPVFAGQGQGLGPGEQVFGELDDFQPDPVGRIVLVGQISHAGVFAAADPVFAAGPVAVPLFQGGELTFPGVGDEAGDAVAVDVGDPQLGAGMGAFPADDDAHAGRPVRSGRAAGSARRRRHPRVGRRRRCRPGSRPVRAGHATAAATGAVTANPTEYSKPSSVTAAGRRACRRRRRCGPAPGRVRRRGVGSTPPQHGDVVGGVVGVGPARPQLHRQRFAGAALAVVEIGQQRGVPKRAFVGWGRVFLVGMGDQDRRVNVDRQRDVGR